MPRQEMCYPHLLRQMELPQPAAYAHAGDVMAENAVGAAAQESFRAFLDKRKH